jgi:hypothetical protein
MISPFGLFLLLLGLRIGKAVGFSGQGEMFMGTDEMLACI